MTRNQPNTSNDFTAQTESTQALTTTLAGAATPNSTARPDLRRDSNGVAIGPWTASVQRANKSFWDRARRRP